MRSNPLSFRPSLAFLTALAVRFFCLMLAGTAVCYAQADYAREKRWAEEITPAILVGDPVYLELKSGHKFLAIYAPRPKAAAAVILVHGLGVHPDWGLINPLRSQLTEQGYPTLSVQMPVLAADADADGTRYPPLFPEAAERLQTAVAYLRGKGYAKIALVSHSMGSRMANFFLNTVAEPHIDAWVAIGVAGTFTEPGTLKVPVLDVYGENDLPAVLQGAATRAAALRKVRGSGQIEIAGADHFYADRESELANQVKLFLDRKLK
jgi:predicted alpha/beta-hydrolase family hydrolase